MSRRRRFAELLARRYDLYLVCGLDVPWANDSIREFREQRLWMHEQYVARAASSGAPWLLVEGSPDERVSSSRAAIAAAFGGDA